MAGLWSLEMQQLHNMVWYTAVYDIQHCNAVEIHTNLWLDRIYNIFAS